MGETKRKNKCIKLLGSVILGLAFLCLGFFAGFGGKIEEFVKGADEPTTGGTTSSYENAMIYVDSGATTNITGGSVGAMSNGNSVYVADGGTLNVTGGTVSGNIYNGGTLNYTAGTLNSVTLASGKYITFKGNPSSTISITLDSPSVGTNIGYLDGITSVTLSRLSVTNLPANTELRIEGGYIKIRYVNRTVTITASPSGYGSVSGSSITIPHGSSLSVSGATISYGGTSITATPATQTARYTYSFDGWYVGDTQITSSRTITANTTITARFTRTTRTYTVTITKNYTSYGEVSTSSVTNVPYGTVLSTSGNTLNVNGTTVIATPAAQTAQYTYAFSGWTNGTATVTGNTTVTANFTKATRTYTVTIYEYNASYGSVSPTVVEDVPYGTKIYRGSSITQLYVGETLVTATPNSSTPQHSYSVSSWREDSSVGKEITTTGFTLEGDKDIYVRYMRSTRGYYIHVRAKYSTSSSGTNSGATAGITGGTATITYRSTDTPTTDSSYVSDYVTYNGSVTLTAEAKTGYVFVGWYSSSSPTSADSTSSSYSLTITGTTYIDAFFRRASYTITIEVSPSGYGSVSRTRVTADYGARITTSGRTLTIGSTDITATPETSTSQHTYSFSSWSNASGTVTGERTITANFSRSTRSYTVTIHEYNGSYGTVSPTTINVPYGTRIYRGSSTTQLYVGATLVTATPNSSTAQYSYSVSSWREDSSSGTTITTTGFTLEGDKDIYVRFTKSTRSYTITIAVSPSGYGSVSRTSITAYYGTSITTSGNTLSIGSTDITATPETSTSRYTYSFSGWSNASGTVTGARTITANFTRSTRTYTVTIASNNTNYGTVSKTSVTADYGARITTSGSTLTIGSTDITATAKKANASGYYQFSRWNTPSTTVTSNITITASFRRYDSSLVVFETDQANLRTGKYDILNLSHKSIYVRDGDTYIIDGNKIEIGDIQVVASGRNDYMMTSQFYRWRNTSTPSVTSGTITGDNNVFHAYSGGWQLTPIKVSLTVRNHINSDAYSIVTEMEDGSTTTVANEQTVEWDVFFGGTIRFGESYVQDTPTMLMGFWVYDWGAGHDALYVSSIDISDFNPGVRVFINGVYVDVTDIGNAELHLVEDVNVLIEIMP